MNIKSAYLSRSTYESQMRTLRFDALKIWTIVYIRTSFAHNLSCNSLSQTWQRLSLRTSSSGSYITPKPCSPSFEFQRIRHLEKQPGSSYGSKKFVYSASKCMCTVQGVKMKCPHLDSVPKQGLSSCTKTVERIFTGKKKRGWLTEGEMGFASS